MKKHIYQQVEVIKKIKICMQLLITVIIQLIMVLIKLPMVVIVVNLATMELVTMELVTMELVTMELVTMELNQILNKKMNLVLKKMEKW